MEQKKRRAASNSRRQGDGISSRHAEEAFALGLADSCPRCGAALADFAGEEEQRAHLRDCNDDVKIKKHCQSKKLKAAAAAATAAKTTAQEDAQAAAAWMFLGSATEQMCYPPPHHTGLIHACLIPPPQPPLARATRATHPPKPCHSRALRR